MHVHAVPRASGDFARNDAVFDAMDLWGPTAEASRARQGAPRLDVPADEDRRDRTAAQMADEASAYRGGPSAAGRPRLTPPSCDVPRGRAMYPERSGRSENNPGARRIL